ncbi:TetR/AcrR family transcriptional regulator [Plantactinospora sp. CA-290183]|uniref:TetR/AcrR family transcriptional regulator n=1 Tax=Plantactinospora sp. CA-290183 TaxID=3240006 RepID=UPI003D8D9356
MSDQSVKRGRSVARAKSDDKREAILESAIRAIAEQGLGVSTAAIAARAGVSNGTLFNYFTTKADLLNQLFVALKTEVGATVMEGPAPDGGLRPQAERAWARWMAWGTADPSRKRALALLCTSHQITAESHAAAADAMAGVTELLERGRVTGVLRDQPLDYAVEVAEALADTTMNFMIREPAAAGRHSAAGFAALWRILT